MNLRWKIAQWLELRWWKNYLNSKNKEEYLRWKKNYWKNILQRIAPEAQVNPTHQVIDLGCGPFGIFTGLTGTPVTAIDPLLDEYEKQIPLFRKSDYPNTNFVCQTIESFETEQKFDLVFCMNAINHVQNLEKGFDKMKEVCAPEGVIVISVDTHNSSSFKYLFRLLPGDILHPHQYDLNEYRAFLEKRGLKILKAELVKREFLFNHHLLIAKPIS